MGRNTGSFRNKQIMSEENLTIENLVLKGDLHDYEIALRRAHEIIAEAKHILSVHAEEIACGTVSKPSDYSKQSIDHPLTQARLEQVKELVEMCEEFERIAPKPSEWAEVIEEK